MRHFVLLIVSGMSGTMYRIRIVVSHDGGHIVARNMYRKEK